MYRSKCASFFGVFLVAILFLLPASQALAGHKPVVMVVPSRYTVVQFGFDMARIRPVTLVAFDSEADPKKPVLHRWSKTQQDWLAISLSDFSNGDLGGNKIILVGSDADMPASIRDAATWATTERIPSMSIMTLMNSLKKDMKFSLAEWKWIAKRHRLQIKDLNAARRKWGKYGPPENAQVDGTIPVANDKPLEEKTVTPVVSPTPVQPANDTPDVLPDSLLDTIRESDTPPEDK